VKNPFVFDKFAVDASFCGRTKEIATLIQRCESSSNSLIYGRRRYGKSSLIHQTFKQLNTKNYVCVYVDLFDANDEYDVAKLIYAACAKALSVYSKTRQGVKNFFKKIALETEIGIDGGVSFIPKLTDLEFEDYLSDALNSLEAYAQKSDKRVVIALDEFQQIALFNKSLDATLRKHVQAKHDFVWMFSGSKRHLLSQLFFDQSNPLYRQAEGIEIKGIEEAEFYEFAKANLPLPLSQDCFAAIYQLADGESKLIQQICNKLFYGAETLQLKAIDIESVRTVVNEILDQEDGIYRMIDGNLSPNQRKTLRHIVRFQGEELAKNDRLRSTNIAKSSLMSALKSLYDGVKGQGYIIDKDYDTYFIPDRAFELWLYRNVFSKLPI
jgi:hypothetical protein